jgi:hypothetical protein
MRRLPLSWADPLEVFYDIGDVDLVAVDASLFQRAIQQRSRRTHEWTASEVLAIA